MNPVPIDVEAVVTQVLAALSVLPDNERKLALLDLERHFTLDPLTELERVRLQLTTTTLTAELLEARQYTYVSVILEGPDDTFEKFLVSARGKEQATLLAHKYVEQQGWKLIPWSHNGSVFTLYPGNYIKEARKLFTAGKYI